jgi:hypothetical protein
MWLRWCSTVRCESGGEHSRHSRPRHVFTWFQFRACTLDVHLVKAEWHQNYCLILQLQASMSLESLQSFGFRVAIAQCYLNPLALAFVHAFFHHSEHDIDAPDNRSNEPRDRDTRIVMSGRPESAMMDNERLDAGKLHASKSPL